MEKWSVAGTLVLSLSGHASPAVRATSWRLSSRLSEPSCRYWGSRVKTGQGSARPLGLVTIMSC